MDGSVAFFLGAVGALAPEIMRLYSIRTQSERFQWSFFYFGISAVFACLGGILALALPATTKWGAIYVGVSTPVLINTILEKAIPGAAKMKSGQDQAVSAARPSLRSFVAGL
jgi:hypothetical protein